MLKVRTYVGKSSIHGCGIFALDDIAPLQVVWQDDENEPKWSEEQFQALPEHLKNVIRIHGWRERLDGLYHLSLDNDQFTNHSDQPNTSTAESGLVYANTYIKAGEEITSDYRDFDITAYDKLRDSI